MSQSSALTVTGQAMQLKDVRAPQLTTRKIYNPAFFFNDTFQHEIANHYRDYKQRPRIRRHRRRKIVVPYRREAFFGVVSGEPRVTLPVSVHYFPRFTATYTATTPRGRQTLCQGAPPDDTYDDTVRRIRRAHSCKEFKVLVDRQLRWKAKTKTKAADGLCRAEKWANARVRSEREKTQRKRNTNVIVDVNANVNVCVNDNCAKVNDSGGKPALNRLGSPQSVTYKDDQQRHKAKSKLTTTQRPDIPDCDNHNKSNCNSSGHCNRNSNTKQRSCEGASCSRLSTFNRAYTTNDAAQCCSTQNYLHWACEYYEQRLLSNIRYLESLGARNAAIKRQQQQLRVQLQQPSSGEESAPTSASSTSNTAASRTSAANTPRLSALECFRLTRLLQRIGRERSFRVGEQQLGGDAYAQSALNVGDARNNCAIRVHIKPSGASSSQCNAAAATGVTRQPCATLAATADAGMQDYLNANLQTFTTGVAAATAASTAAYNNTINSNCATSASPLPREQTNFHTLIDHLTQLEISDIEASSLPKITLTDCSSTSSGAASGVFQSVATAAAANVSEVTNAATLPSAFDSDLPLDKQLQQQQQQQLERRSTFKLKQTKFDFLRESLEIPDTVYYRSEARPP